MSSTNKGLFSLFTPLLILLVCIAGCEEPGSVGGEFVEGSELTFDTLDVTGIQQQQYNGYSGRLSYLPIGKYSDPVFGDVEIKSLFKPSISNVSLDSLDGTIEDHHKMKLQIVLDSTAVYGDTLSESGYKIYEVTSIWRGKPFRLDSEFSYDETNLVGQFTISPEEENDTLEVPLEDWWKDKYNSFLSDTTAAADSLYKYDFYGLVIVPDDNVNRISFPNIGPANTRFLVEDEAFPDSAFGSITLADWAYTLQRSNQNALPDMTPLHSTVESIMKLDTTSLSLDYMRNKNFIKAELILYEAADYLQQNLPMDHQRVNVPSVNLVLGSQQNVAHSLQFGSIAISGNLNSGTEKRYYQFNVSNLVNNYLYGARNVNDIYLGIGSNTGISRSTLIYNENAPEHLRPKIVIAFLEEGEQQ